MLRIDPRLVLCCVLFCGCEPTKPATPPDVPNDGVPAPAEASAASTEPFREKAAVGVGERGQDLGEGPISTVAKAKFTAQERVAFDMQIPQAMNLFKAEHGQAPQSHDEFMEVIIKANHISLPPLPEGRHYVYDPEREEFMVEHSP